MADTSFNPLGHISIGVRDIDVSRAFYSAVLEPIGLHLVFDSETEKEPQQTTTQPAEDSMAKGETTTAAPKVQRTHTRTLGYGRDAENELLNIFEFGAEAAAPGPGFHLALNAPSRDAVLRFHASALGFGGQNNGLPGVRKHYGKHYYAAFVVDPDGWRLEAVCKDAVPDHDAGEGETEAP